MIIYILAAKILSDSWPIVEVAAIAYQARLRVVAIDQVMIPEEDLHSDTEVHARRTCSSSRQEREGEHRSSYVES
jgi:hypothetical protein